MSKSFFDLDYIIELNEKRLEEYTALYQKVFEKLTHIILIYSALGIFLVTLIQHVIEKDIKPPLFYLFITIFIILILISIIFFIKLLLPIEIAYLDPPKKYYGDFKLQLEVLKNVNQKNEDDSLKGSYILELEAAITNNGNVFRKKSSFYYRALLFALLAVLPYLVCLGYHISEKEDRIQKVKLIAEEK